VASREPRSNGPVEIRRLSLLLIGLTLVQYLLGMVLNLFVVISRQHPGASGSDYFVRAYQSMVWGLTHGGVLAFHIGLGIVLLLGSIRLAVATWAVAQPRVRTVGVAGSLAILAAAFNGASFLNYNEDVNSMLMAAFFAIALFCFAWTLFRATTAAPEPQHSAG